MQQNSTQNQQPQQRQLVTLRGSGAMGQPSFIRSQYHQQSQQQQQVSRPTSDALITSGINVISSSASRSVNNDEPVIIVETSGGSHNNSTQNTQHHFIATVSSASSPMFTINSSSLIRASPANQQRPRLISTNQSSHIAQGAFGTQSGTPTIIPIPIINQNSGTAPRQFIRIQPPIPVAVQLQQAQQQMQHHNHQISAVPGPSQQPQPVGNNVVVAPNQNASALQPVVLSGSPIRIRPISMSEFTAIRLTNANEGNLTNVKRNVTLISPVSVVTRPNVQSSGQIKDDMYKRKHYLLKKSIKSLVFKNAALCDEVARLHQRIQTVTEERKILLRKLLAHERVKEKRSSKKSTAKTTLNLSLTSSSSSASSSTTNTVSVATASVTIATAPVSMATTPVAKVTTTTTNEIEENKADSASTVISNQLDESNNAMTS